MSFAGDLGPATAGEIDSFSISFAGRLQSGETLASATAKMMLWEFSPVEDSNAANLVLGPPVAAGATASVLAGGLGETGFQPNGVYSLYFFATTTLGRSLIAYGNITCGADQPPAAASSGSLPSNSEIVTANLTASTSTTYVITQPGVTFTLPASWAPTLGAVTVVDGTGLSNPALTIAGAIANLATPLTVSQSGFSATFAWVTAVNQWVHVS